MQVERESSSAGGGAVNVNSNGGVVGQRAMEPFNPDANLLHNGNNNNSSISISNSSSNSISNSNANANANANANLNNIPPLSALNNNSPPNGNNMVMMMQHGNNYHPVMANGAVTGMTQGNSNFARTFINNNNNASQFNYNVNNGNSAFNAPMHVERRYSEVPVSAIASRFQATPPPFVANQMQSFPSQNGPTSYPQAVVNPQLYPQVQQQFAPVMLPGAQNLPSISNPNNMIYKSNNGGNTNEANANYANYPPYPYANTNQPQYINNPSASVSSNDNNKGNFQPNYSNSNSNFSYPNLNSFNQNFNQSQNQFPNNNNFQPQFQNQPNQPNVNAFNYNNNGNYQMNFNPANNNNNNSMQPLPNNVNVSFNRRASASEGFKQNHNMMRTSHHPYGSLGSSVGQPAAFMGQNAIASASFHNTGSISSSNSSRSISSMPQANNNQQLEEQKRLMHTMSERNRRKMVNDGLDRLKSRIPQFSNGMSRKSIIKADIVMLARNYLIELKSQTGSLEEQVKELEKEALALGIDPKPILEEARERALSNKKEQDLEHKIKTEPINNNSDVDVESAASLINFLASSNVNKKQSTALQVIANASHEQGLDTSPGTSSSTANSSSASSGPHQRARSTSSSVTSNSLNTITSQSQLAWLRRSSVASLASTATNSSPTTYSKSPLFAQSEPTSHIEEENESEGGAQSSNGSTNRRRLSTLKLDATGSPSTTTSSDTASLSTLNRINFTRRRSSHQLLGAVSNNAVKPSQPNNSISDPLRRASVQSNATTEYDEDEERETLMEEEEK